MSRVDDLRISLQDAMVWSFDHDVDVSYDLVLRAIKIGIFDDLSFAGKTYEFFLKNLERLIVSVYDGNLGGEFSSILRSLIDGQIKKAYQQAWLDNEDKDEDEPAPEYLAEAARAFITEQQNFVGGFYKDIVDAKVDQTGHAALTARAPMWANRYNEAYSHGKLLIASHTGGKLQWHLGQTEKHCPSCSALDGIVAYAYEWEKANIRPQAAPNKYLDCEGWNCDCGLDPTEARRTRGAFDRIRSIGRG